MWLAANTISEEVTEQLVSIHLTLEKKLPSLLTVLALLGYSTDEENRMLQNALRGQGVEFVLLASQLANVSPQVRLLHTLDISPAVQICLIVRPSVMRANQRDCTNWGVEYGASCSADCFGAVKMTHLLWLNGVSRTLDSLAQQGPAAFG